MPTSVWFYSIDKKPSVKADLGIYCPVLGLSEYCMECSTGKKWTLVSDAQRWSPDFPKDGHIYIT